MEFNSSQRAAAEHFEGPMLVLAGPGSGKTTVIIRRLKNLIEQHKVPPENILAVTFSRAAAEEMRSRFEAAEKGGTGIPAFGTFHSIFYNILRAGGSAGRLRLISEKEKYSFFKTHIGYMQVSFESENEFLGTLINTVSRIKNSPGPVSIRVPDGISACDMQKLYTLYEQYKNERGLLDFDDMIIKCRRLLLSDEQTRLWWQEQFRFLLVDEFQDINEMQYETIKLLCGRDRNIFAVGDDDQSIYAFRGASPGIMKKFLSDFEDAKCVQLGINYRSGVHIINAAGSVIGKNTDRIPKTILAFREESKYGDGGISFGRFKNRPEEFAAIAAELAGMPAERLKNIAVLFRGNKDSLLLQHELGLRGVPFRVRGRRQSIFEHFIFKDLLAYVRLANAAAGKMQRSDLLRIVNRPVRYIAREALRQEDGEDLFVHMKRFYHSNPGMLARIGALERELAGLRGLSMEAAYMYILKAAGYEEWLKGFARDRQSDFSEYGDILEALHVVFRDAETLSGLLRLMDAEEKARENEESSAESGVNIMTMHASKGLEFDTVYIPDVNEGVVPNKNSLRENGLEEERRLFYVAMTRAKRSLKISYAERLHEKKAEPSRFIKDMQSGLSRSASNFTLK